MHLRNFCQVSIEEVRQEMTGSAVKSSALDRNSEGYLGWKLETIKVTHPLWKMSGYATGRKVSSGFFQYLVSPRF